MMHILKKLDQAPRWPDEPWFLDVEESLSRHPEDWVEAVRDAGRLSDKRAWALLAWVEQAATSVAREGSRTLLETAVFGRSLLEASEIDYRDIAIVESLLRRGAQIGAVNFEDAVEAGCTRAGKSGVEARTTLLGASAATPGTHEEHGAGPSFAFRRRPVTFDIEELQRWLDEGHK